MRLRLLKTLVVTGMALFALTACGNETENTVKNEESVVEAVDNEIVAAEENSVEETSEERAEAKVVDIAGFANIIIEERADISLVEMNEGYVSGVMDFDLTKVAEYVVCVDASGTTVDEFGIFKANENAGEDVEGMISEYLAVRLDTWMDEYMPEEKPKVENAQIKNHGDYYIYAILADTEKEHLFGAFEEALSE